MAFPHPRYRNQIVNREFWLSAVLSRRPLVTGGFADKVGVL